MCVSYFTLLYAGIALRWLATQREVNDETRSNHNRNCGLFDFNRLGGGGECTGQYQPERLPGKYGRAVRSEGTSLRHSASLWPFSKIYPSSLPSVCSPV